MQRDTTHLTEVAIDSQARVAAVVVAALLGVFFLAGAGFLNAEILHSAAHDARHAFAFPCH